MSSTNTVPSIAEENQASYLLISNSITDFLDWIGATPKRVAGFVLIFELIANTALALYFQVWNDFQITPTLTGQGLKWDFGAMAIDYVAQPILLGIFVWLTYAGNDLISNLIKKGCLNIDDELANILNDATKTLNSSWAPWIFLLFAVVLQTVITVLNTDLVETLTTSWIRGHPTILIFRFFLGVITYFAMGLSIYYLWIMLGTLGKIMNTDKVILKPFDPDRAAGLGVIGRFSANLGYVVLAFGVVIMFLVFDAQSETSITITIFVALSIGLYVIVTIALFFLPLYSTHKAMARCKFGDLQKVAGETELVYQELIKSPRIAENDRMIEEMQDLQQVNSWILNIPDWPFNYASLRKYIILVLTPLAAILIELFISLLGKLI